MVSITEESLESIKSNIDRSEKIVTELIKLTLSFNVTKAEEKSMIKKSAEALIEQLKVINEPIELLLLSINVETFPEEKKKKRKSKGKRKKYERITTLTGPVYISQEKKQKFLKDLGIEKKYIRKIRKKILNKKIPKTQEISTHSTLASFSNKLFYKVSSNLSKTAFFKGVQKDLRKASMSYTLKTYISITLFLTLLTFIVSFILALFFTSSFITGIRNLGIALILTIIIFFLALSWPANTASSNRKKIDSELPFATSHMAAIASSKVEPSRIFSIMTLSKEYIAISTECRKIVNQINVYGYNLTTSLKNVAKQTPSKSFAELINGMATTITTGGNLATYLNERAKGILLDYKLKHERYASIIGMYSDIYTALLIAAPLIFMLLLAIISIIGSTFMGMPASTLANLGIIVIAVLNVAFLIFLQLTQPNI